MLDSSSWVKVARRCRESRSYTVLVVSVALFVDNMLVTTLAPLIPTLLLQTLTPATVPNLTAPANYSVVTDNGSNGVHGYSSMAIGVLFAIKGFTQLIVNPFVGTLTSTIGYNIPMLIGFIIMFTATIVFALGKTYWLLLVARSSQGFGSAFTSVAGMGYLAMKFPDDKDRGKAMSYALTGIALGVTLGPPFASVVNEFFSVSTPYLIIAVIALFDGLLQLLFFDPGAKSTVVEKPTSILILARDPYILLSALAIFVANAGISILEPTLPIRMKHTMNSGDWELGVVFVPCSVGYLIGAKFFANITQRIGRWLGMLIGIVGCSVSIVCIPFGQNMYHLMAPLAVLGFAIGLIDCAAMPLLAHLVDTRYTSSYGSVYAIGDTALCAGFCFGPVFSGFLLSGLGFSWSMYSIGIVSVCSAPLMIFLRNPPPKNKSSPVVPPEPEMDEGKVGKMKLSTCQDNQ